MFNLPKLMERRLKTLFVGTDLRRKDLVTREEEEGRDGDPTGDSGNIGYPS